MHLVLTELPLSARHGLFPGLGMGLGSRGQESGAELSLSWGLKPGARQGDEDWALGMCGNVTRPIQSPQDFLILGLTCKLFSKFLCHRKE